MVPFLIVPLTLSTIPFVLGVLGFVRRCSILFFSQASSSLEGFSQRFSFFDLISLFVNSRPLSVKTCVISKVKKAKHSYVYFFSQTKIIKQVFLRTLSFLSLRSEA